MQVHPNYAARAGCPSTAWLNYVPRSSPCALSGHMGDTRLQGNHRPRPAVQHAKAKRPEVHVPQAVVDRLDADRLAGERLAEAHMNAGPLDRSVARHLGRSKLSG